RLQRSTLERQARVGRGVTAHHQEAGIREALLKPGEQLQPLHLRKGRRHEDRIETGLLRPGERLDAVVHGGHRVALAGEELSGPTTRGGVAVYEKEVSDHVPFRSGA